MLGQSDLALDDHSSPEGSACCSRSELSYGYSSGRHTVDRSRSNHVSVTVERGSLTGLLGPTAAARRRCLNLLSGVLQPEHGHVSLNGASLAGRSRP
jgi:ABC-type Na+ transport system ATPase subunit NatA